MARGEKKGLFKRLTDAFFEEVGAQSPAQSPVQSPDPKPEGDDARVSALGAALVPEAEKAIDWDSPAVYPLQRPFRAQPEVPRPPSSPSTATPSKKDESSVAQSADQQSFEAKLTAMPAKEAAATAAGRLQLLHLDEFKEQLGDKWTALADKARETVSSVLTEHLAPGDIFSPFEESSFVILFATLNEDQARLKAASVVARIRERIQVTLGPDARSDVSAQIGSVGALLGPLKLRTLPSLAEALARTPNIAPTPGALALDAELRKQIGEIGISYRPTWFTPRGVIALYDARLQRLDERQTVRSGSRAYLRNDPSILVAIDRAVLAQCIVDLRALVAGNKPALIVVPLHLTSIVGPGGGMLIDMLRAMPQQIRAYLVCEILGFNSSALLPRLAEAVRLILPLCRKVSLRLPLAFGDHERLVRLGIQSIGYDLEEMGLGDTALRELPEAVMALPSRAQSQRLLTHLYGASRPDVVTAARDAGYHYVNGPAIGRDMPRPGGVASFQPPQPASP